MNSKQTIIAVLKQANGVVSGQTLSARLGISRVSIWKHIKGLIQTGAPIVSSPKGYRLMQDPDSLLPWCFDTRSDRVHYFPEIDSTMDEAMRLARKGCPDFSVVVAQRQTRGRGRMQRSWVSDEGGLYFTVVVRPDIPLMRSGLVNLAAAVDMARVLRSKFGINAGLKWPNDILVDKRKICGILTQIEGEGDQIAHMNIGVGLNVNNSPDNQEPSAVSLKSLLGRSVPRRDLLVAFLDAFEQCLSTFDAALAIKAWKSSNVTLGRKVRVATFKETVVGTALDVDTHGGLIVQLADGSRQTVVHGDCFIAE